jgi:hypothetical protein
MSIRAHLLPDLRFDLLLACLLVVGAIGCGGTSAKQIGEPCVASSQCDLGLVCDFGQTPHVCAMTNSTDAAEIDSAGDDAAIAIDGAAIDGGVIDGPRPDATVIDGSGIDALPIDALPIDALPIDALPIDALPIDAVPLDAPPDA